METRSPTFRWEIALVSCAALLLEVSYTRVVSFKLYYFFAYLVLGFAMLGLGSGGVLMVVLASLGRLPLRRLLVWGCLAGSLAVGVGYLVIARMPFDTRALWTGVAEPAKLLAICAALYGSFLAIGVMIAALLSRRSGDVARLYGADLMGAGVGCAAAVPLMTSLGPPAAIFLAAALLAAVGAHLARRESRSLLVACCTAVLVLGTGAAFPRWIPDPLPDRFGKNLTSATVVDFSRWSPVFRIDVSRLPGPDTFRVIMHDGIWGSTLHRFDGDLSRLEKFERDPRSLPFSVLEEPPAQVVLIGSAGGHEILASLYFGAGHVTAIELNPVTVSLLTTVFPDYTGELHRHPRVTLVNDEGRSFLARDPRTYDLIYFMAPDSYAAMNTATSGAFVLSESYLYTQEMVVESLRHLKDDGVICVQFGEWRYDERPLRTTRYLATARAAYARLGITGFGRHMAVVTTSEFMQLTTILLKKRPFTNEEVERLERQTAVVEGGTVRFVAGALHDRGPVGQVLTRSDSDLARWHAEYAYDVAPVSDDAPFFWHFTRFRSALTSLLRRYEDWEMEETLGERLLLVLVLVSAVFAAAFLLLPFLLIRATWSALPHKGLAALYFTALGLGFMLYEICLIQKLTLFLGYPTYSLTVTLMTLLVSTGVGSLATSRYAGRAEARRVLFAALVVLTLFYLLGLGALVDTLLGAPIALRVAVTVTVVAPLGLVLGAFMPLGLTAVAGLTDRSREYVAWGWALNGFASVVGSVLTTIMSMSFGFSAVLVAGLTIYALAAIVLRRLASRTQRASRSPTRSGRTAGVRASAATPTP